MKHPFILISMLKYLSIFCFFSMFTFLQGYAKEGRHAILLTGGGWSLWLDKEASWQNDRLYLPHEVTDLSLLPVNPPTGGWQVLENNPDAVAVNIPGTVEEYLTVSDTPRPEDFRGVSWWYRKITLPVTQKNKHFIIYFESVRMRAEVYLDGKLVGYDLIGETPFHIDITDEVKLGVEHLLAVRVTNPGGNFHWQDFDILKWGKYNVPPGRSFSGIIGRVKLESLNPIFISDIYMQNTPEVTKVNAILSITNKMSFSVRQDIELQVCEKKNPDKVVFKQTIRKLSLSSGNHEVIIPVNVPDAKLWELSSPELYTCRVRIKQGKNVLDEDMKNFGFRWFNVDGVGKNAVFRLNGRRMMLKSAISWGYFPVTGLVATPEMAEKQVLTAKKLGLNMLNFHRCIGSPVVLEKADELGLLYYEEPGSFHSANHDPFIRTIVNEKLKRMVYRDRSHPSLVIFNLINEFGGRLSKDKELVAKRMNDMREAHAVDPSRIMTFTSGWANSENEEEDSKAKDAVIYALYKEDVIPQDYSGFKRVFCRNKADYRVVRDFGRGVTLIPAERLSKKYIFAWARESFGKENLFTVVPRIFGIPEQKKAFWEVIWTVREKNGRKKTNRRYYDIVGGEFQETPFGIQITDRIPLDPHGQIVFVENICFKSDGENLGWSR